MSAATYVVSHAPSANAEHWTCTDPLTFAGLTGLGDLMATCSSPLSRNRHVGEQIARKFNTLEDAIKSAGLTFDVIAKPLNALIKEKRHVPKPHEVADTIRSLQARMLGRDGD